MKRKIALYAALTLWGFTVVVSQIAWLGTALRIAGAVYLVYLGLSLFLAASEGEVAEPRAQSAKGDAVAGLRIGLLTALTNPMAIAFFLSHFVGDKPLVQRMVGDTVELPRRQWLTLSWMWIGYFTLLATANLYIAYHYDTSVWVNFKLYGTLGVVFATLAWLLFFGRLVVYATVVNVVRWEEDHGTVVLEMEAPRVAGDTTGPVDVTRAGETRPHAAPAGV